MKIGFKFRHLESSDALKNFAREKLIKIERYLDAEEDEVELIASFNPKRNLHRADLQIITGGAHTLNSHEETEDMYNSIDMAVDKLEKQLRRHKEAIQAKKRKAAMATRAASKV
jgi:putative sigma-54 modulation protein